MGQSIEMKSQQSGSGRECEPGRVKIGFRFDLMGLDPVDQTGGNRENGG
jgi:hypothetical protein